MMEHTAWRVAVAMLGTIGAVPTGSKYPDGRPEATLRMEAKDQGVLLRHGGGPGSATASDHGKR